MDDAVAIDSGRLSQIILREASDAIIYAGTRGIIRFWNHGAEQVFGFAEGEAPGQSLDMIIPESLRARHWAGYSATMHSGSTRYSAGEYWRCRPCEKTGGASRSSSRSCHSETNGRDRGDLARRNGPFRGNAGFAPATREAVYSAAAA
jgi:PAS domain-containing protein